MWRFRGTPHYLEAQCDRLGLSKVLVARARNNRECHRVTGLLGQLCGRYHQAPRDDGRAVVVPGELAQVRATLGQCELELEKLHALAATTQAMIDEAHRAFGLEPPDRCFRVQCDFDDVPETADLTSIKLTGARTAKAN